MPTGLLDSDAMTSPVLQAFRDPHHLAAKPANEVCDSELVDRFVHHRDESAFDRLLQRHGRMVLGVIRSLLPDRHDAEDVFQATFLALACRARFVRKKTSLRSWLYAVAYRTAIKARSAAQRRRRVEQGAAMSYSDHAPPPVDRDEWPILAEELHRLPAKYREPLRLCYLEGKTTGRAAQELCWPLGTVKIRLMRARGLLRSRLARRGVSLPPAALGAQVVRVGTGCSGSSFTRFSNAAEV